MSRRCRDNEFPARMFGYVCWRRKTKICDSYSLFITSDFSYAARKSPWGIWFQAEVGINDSLRCGGIWAVAMVDSVQPVGLSTIQAGEAREPIPFQGIPFLILRFWGEYNHLSFLLWEDMNISRRNPGSGQYENTHKTSLKKLCKSINLHMNFIYESFENL